MTKFQAALSPKQVLDIRHKYVFEKLSMTKLAKLYCVSRGTIHAVLKKQHPYTTEYTADVNATPH